MKRFETLILALVCGFGGAALAAQEVEIDQQRGADRSRVDYRALERYGPWDDRNYAVTKEELEYLAPNEEELREPLPVWFRVKMRQAWPELRKEGPAQYPRSALQIFLQQYRGFQRGNRYYRELTYDAAESRFRVMDEAEVRDLRAAAPDSRFLSGETRVTSPIGAAESAIKINPVDPNLVIAGSNGPGGGQKMHFSSDGGDTWTETTLPLGGTCCDPTVEWSSDGSIAHAATLGNCSLSGCAIWYYRSSNNGQTWTDLDTDTPGDPRRELTNSRSDKEYLHVDKSPTSPFQDNVYLTWHDANTMQFARSTDNGNTWTKTSFSADPEGIGSDITTDAGGNIYYFWPGTGTKRIELKRSTDGGASFAAGTTTVATTNGAFDFPIPSMESRFAWIYVSADADLSNGPFGGSIYAAWTDTTGPESNNPAANHTRIQVAFSRDQGATWSVVTPHETADANTVDRWNQWLAVAPNGDVHVVFYDTRHDASRRSVDLYHSFSTDGAQTFSTPQRLTAQSSPNIADSFEFGDYNGLDIVMNDLITVFTDNRAEGAGAGDSQDVYAIGRDLSGAPVVSLINTDPTNAVLGEGDTTTVQATVTSSGAPLPGVTVDFSSADTSLASVSPATAITNASGQAQATVTGETTTRTTVEITATSSGDSDSVTIRVPDLSGLGLLILLAALGSFGWLRQRAVHARE